MEYFSMGAETSSVSDVGHHDAGRWRALILICLAQVGAMSTWFSAAAVGPTLASEWGLSAAEVGSLTAAVQL
ncbi:MAG: hypothetical protein ACKVVP_08050, partial [Chloroflexota bacterium]